MRRKLLTILFLQLCVCSLQAQGFQRFLHRTDSLLDARQRRKKIDTAYIIRPKTKWTVTGRVKVTGTKLEIEGKERGVPFHSKMKADYKSTISVGVNYSGVSLFLSLNPAKLMGKYKDFELNLSSYGNRWGFDVSYQDARNFTGWHDEEGRERIHLPADVLRMKTFNANAYYAFNHKRFSYPAAFNQSCIQRRSAGSFLLGLSGQWQYATVDAQQFESQYKAITIGIGAGYGYNWVPGRNWLVHLSALPTFCLISHKTLLVNNEDVPFKYHFPEVIITGRGAIVRQFGNWFAGTSMQYNFNNVGDKNKLAVNNQKWLARLFVGCRF